MIMKRKTEIKSADQKDNGKFISFWEEMKKKRKEQSKSL